MERVLTVNHLLDLACSFPRGGHRALARNKGGTIKALMLRLLHTAGPNGPACCVREQSVFDAPSGIAAPFSFCWCISCCHVCSNKRRQRHRWRFTTHSVTRLASPTKSPTFPARARHTQSVLIYIRPSILRTEHLLTALRVKPCGLRSLRSLRAGDLVGLAHAHPTARAHRNSPLDPPSGSRLAVALRALLPLSQP